MTKFELITNDQVLNTVSSLGLGIPSALDIRASSFCEFLHCLTSLFPAVLV
jgi:hypothetical protein